MAAFLCDRILIETDGVKSAIRIVDRVMRNITSPNPPEQMAPFDYDLTLLVSLKAGWTHGSYPLRIDVVRPDSDTRTILDHSVFFEGGEERGIDTVVRMMVRYEYEGVYWFRVLFNGNPLTQIPLRVIYQRRVTPGPGPGPAGSSPPSPGPQPAP
mgnify:CR=1 FL=1